MISLLQPPLVPTTFTPDNNAARPAPGVRDCALAPHTTAAAYDSTCAEADTRGDHEADWATAVPLHPLASTPRPTSTPPAQNDARASSASVLDYFGAQPAHGTPPRPEPDRLRMREHSAHTPPLDSEIAAPSAAQRSPNETPCASERNPAVDARTTASDRGALRACGGQTATRAPGEHGADAISPQHQVDQPRGPVTAQRVDDDTDLGIPGMVTHPDMYNIYVPALVPTNTEKVITANRQQIRNRAQPLKYADTGAGFGMHRYVLVYRHIGI